LTRSAELSAAAVCPPATSVPSGQAQGGADLGPGVVALQVKQHRVRVGCHGLFARVSAAPSQARGKHARLPAPSIRGRQAR
jgi:hypothetical protein